MNRERVRWIDEMFKVLCLVNIYGMTRRNSFALSACRRSRVQELQSYNKANYYYYYLISDISIAVIAYCHAIWFKIAEYKTAKMKLSSFEGCIYRVEFV